MATLKEQADEQFLVDFFLHPSIREVNEQYRWNPAEHPLVVSSNRFDPHKIMKIYLTPVLAQYFGMRSMPLPKRVAHELVQLAKNYAQLDLGHCEYLDSAIGAVQYARLSALLERPEFIADESAVSVMVALRDIRYSEPWGFEMWVRYVKDGESGKPMLIPGFGLEQLNGFDRLINTDELWTGKSREMKRVFFSSVGNALSHLSNDYPVEALKPRMELLRRNFHYEYHEPWCVASFRPQELERLEQIAATTQDPTIATQLRTALDTIRTSSLGSEGYMSTPHWC